MENHNSLYKKEHKLLQCTAKFLAPRSYSCNFYRANYFATEIRRVKIYVGKKMNCYLSWKNEIWTEVYGTR